MPFYAPDGLKVFTFESLAGQPVTQAILTRQGGVSPQPWSALNLGGTVGDDQARVLENRRRAFQAAGVTAESIYDAWQVHSAEVITTDRPRPPAQRHLEADAILTDTPGVTLFMRFADCVPILLLDPRRRAIGLVHAGWQGTVRRIVQRAVERMQAQYRSDPVDILAAIGPSIAQHHYEIGPEVAAQVHEAFREAAAGLLQPADKPGRGPKLDLWAANRLALEQAGVRQVEISGLCTACHPEDWYSHRGEAGKTGRFGVLFGLKA